MNTDCEHEDTVVIVLKEEETPGTFDRHAVSAIERCIDCNAVFKKIYQDNTIEELNEEESNIVEFLGQ